MRFVDDLRSLPKRWSTRLATIQFTSVLAYWGLVPAEWKAAVPSWALAGALLFFGVSFIGAQSVSQPKLRKDDSPTGKDQP